MLVYLISGDGAGAGKTTLAKRLVGDYAVYSLAGELRRYLKKQYPNIDWENKTQDYKDKVEVSPGLTVRQKLIEEGQKYSRDNPIYWAEKLVERLGREFNSIIAIDDLRKQQELEYLRFCFPTSYHFHVAWPGAVAEPIFDNEYLKTVCDYVAVRQK